MQPRDIDRILYDEWNAVQWADWTGPIAFSRLFQCALFVNFDEGPDDGFGAPHSLDAALHNFLGRAFSF
jgi:hypothetical protein